MVFPTLGLTFLFGSLFPQLTIPTSWASRYLEPLLMRTLSRMVKVQ